MQYINTSKSTTVKDILAKDFITAFAAYLKKSGKFKIPEWAAYAKTACFKELSPYDPDWLYIRAAAIARQVYFRRSIGLTALRDHFGGRINRGSVPSHHKRAAGKVIRYCLKQLSDMGIVGVIKEETENDSGKTTVFRTLGRQITKKGTTDMDRVSSLVVKEQKKN